MVLLTANPPLVSHDQILKADLVVVGRRIRAAEGRVRVERVVHGNAAVGDELRVLQAADLAGMTDDRDYVFPLSNARQDFSVTKLGDGQQVPPLVYPATPAMIEEIKAVLRDRK